MNPTFKELYCAIHRIEPSAFMDHVLPKALYPHARLVRILFALIPDYLASDREFLRSVGDLRCRRFLSAEAREFHSHRDNRNFSRRFLFLRVSAKRTCSIMKQLAQADES